MNKWQATLGRWTETTPSLWQCFQALRDNRLDDLVSDCAPGIREEAEKRALQLKELIPGRKTILDHKARIELTEKIVGLCFPDGSGSSHHRDEVRKYLKHRLGKPFRIA